MQTGPQHPSAEICHILTTRLTLDSTQSENLRTRHFVAYQTVRGGGNTSHFEKIERWLLWKVYSLG